MLLSRIDQQHKRSNTSESDDAVAVAYVRTRRGSLTPRDTTTAVGAANETSGASCADERKPFITAQATTTTATHFSLSVYEDENNNELLIDGGGDGAELAFGSSSSNSGGSPPHQAIDSSKAPLHTTDSLDDIDRKLSDDNSMTQTNGSTHFSTPHNRPQDTNIAQQRLIAWKPMLTPKFVINLFLICSILFLPIGIILYFTSNSIYEFHYDYTDCADTANRSATCHEQVLWRGAAYRCVCRVHFYEDRFQDETLFVYYMLDNYFQSTRRYVRSLDNYQLLGMRAASGDELAGECEPFRYVPAPTADGVDRRLRVTPCGAIANSFFNDTFTIFYVKRSTNESIRLNISKKEIAWESDRRFKYNNPAELNLENTIKPHNWAKNLSQLDNGFRNEDLMVWMRTAAFPSFRKLYGRILIEENTRLASRFAENRTYFNKFYRVAEKLIAADSSSTPHSSASLAESAAYTAHANKSGGGVGGKMTTIGAKIGAVFQMPTLANSSIIKYRLPKGHYYVDIEYNYLTKQFNGKKWFVLANVSWTGGKCYFLAMAYIVVGIVCFLVAVVLFFVHVYFGNMHYNTAVLLMDTSAVVTNSEFR